MAKLDEVKEEVGWLKIIFAICIATGISLFAWVFQNHKTVPIEQTIMVIIAIISIVIICMIINRNTRSKIKSLGGL